MTSFDDRDKGFENKYAHEEEITFKANARCNRMLGQWAATQLGKTDADAEQYVHSVIEAAFGGGGHVALENKLLEDLTKAGLSVTIKDIQKEAARLLPLARMHVMGHAG